MELLAVLGQNEWISLVHSVNYKNLFVCFKKDVQITLISGDQFWPYFVMTVYFMSFLGPTVYGEMERGVLTNLQLIGKVCGGRRW